MRPQMVYSYIRNQGKNPFPTAVTQDSNGQDRLVVNLEEGLAWFNAKQDGIATYAGTRFMDGYAFGYYTGVDVESQGVEFRGTPDTLHVTVSDIDLQASPWPTVMLKDCQTGGDWQEYSIKTGKKVPLAENSDVPPPYLITARMIFYKNHWGLHSTTADKSRTCTA